jgi:hypothetical protein
MLTSALSNVIAAGLVAGLVAGCGGGKGAGPSEPTAADLAIEGADHAPAKDESGDMAGPEAMDQIKRALDRKRGAVARCLAPVVDSKDLPKNSHGKMTLAFVISPQGKAGDIKVVHTDLESKALVDCVLGQVGQIEFPTLPKPLDWSYTYAFEAM